MKKTYLVTALTGFLILLFCLVAYAVQRSMPKEVQFVSEKAEDIIDFILNKQWTKAESALSGIVQNEEKVIEEMLKNGLPLSAADELSYFISRISQLVKEKKEPIVAALAANQITDLLMDLERHYPQKIPTDISRIDYLGREVVLLSQIPYSSDLLNKRITQLQGTWNGLKPTIEKHKGGKIVSQMDRLMVGLRKESAHSKMEKDGNRILDLVDNMEALFK